MASVFSKIWSWLKYIFTGTDYINCVIILYEGKELNKMILKDNQQGSLAVMARTKKGHPGQIEGTPTWSSSNSMIAAVVPSSDGLSAIVSAGTLLGDATITVSAQVMGNGGLVTTLTKSGGVTVVAGNPVEIFIIEGDILDVP